MDTNPRECLFCHGDLPVKDGQPVNLAFLEHIEDQGPCREEFEVWTQNMGRDFLGD